MNRPIRVLLAGIGAAGTAAVFAVSGIASSAGAVTATGFTATQPVSQRDDSGANGGNWALDQFGATLHLTTHGIVANSNCPGIAGFSGACHKITGTITDTGTFTTQPGNLVPGTGSLNGGSAPQIGAQVTGPMHGTLSYSFFTNVALSAFSTGHAPGSVMGDSPSTGQWPEQFAPPGTQFWDGNGNTGGAEYLGSGPFNFTYTAALGSDSQCPNVSGKWIDGSAASSNDGSNPVAGNILAPSSSSC
jgi:hypothetical protein